MNNNVKPIGLEVRAAVKSVGVWDAWQIRPISDVDYRLYYFEFHPDFKRANVLLATRGGKPEELQISWTAVPKKIPGKSQLIEKVQKAWRKRPGRF